MTFVDRCLKLAGRGTKPTLPEVRPLVREYYAMPGNLAGGGLHVVLDDGNYERRAIRYCLANPRDAETSALGQVLLLLSNSQRRRL